MPLPITIPNTFANATSAIPLSQLDNNFTTVVNGINGIGNGTNSLANVSITGGNVTVSTVSSTAGATFATSSGNVGIGTAAPAVKLEIVATDAMRVPVGTTGQRPTGATGYIRYNTTTSSFEGHNGSNWGTIGGGASGGGTDQIFYLNGQTVTTNYSIPSGQNAGTFGPLTINSGATVTVPTGSTWTVV